DGELLEGMLLDQSLRVSRRLRRDDVTGRIVQLKIRYHDFSTYTRRVTLAGPTADADEIYRVARHLFQRVWSHKAVRLIGVGVSGIQQAASEMLDLFSSPQKNEKRRNLTRTIDQIEERFGQGKVIRAKMLGREKAGGTGTPSKKDTERPRPGREKE
ncbi:MAG: hypothetical protein KJ970_01215, partial [Candidatus Eisenbacteria bacterium]|nr:hypothetical protein [Candidatus Eisenbacteria bacterium]MBU1949703.1 hypothetical protein [Candidatus Eisenbacteria bacterium]MBU2689521.1 hypothetical protein [Candidatus Eisenbacteria bacterium]